MTLLRLQLFASFSLAALLVSLLMGFLVKRAGGGDAMSCAAAVVAIVPIYFFYRWAIRFERKG